jgi:hypothetical protein
VYYTEIFFDFSEGSPAKKGQPIGLCFKIWIHLFYW